MSQSSCSAKDVQVSVVALTTKTLTRGTEYTQQKPQAIYSVSWRRFRNFSCRYVRDVTDRNNLLSATGNENNGNHRQYPHYHTDRTKVTRHETLVLRNTVCYVSIKFHK
jgi:hypothetical protein